MKVYFTASVSGKEDYIKNYEAIVGALKDLGHKVFAEHILKTSKTDISSQSDRERLNYYRKMIEMISQSDFCIAEVSTSSLSVGHEITVALDKAKPVIVLYDHEVAPNLIRAINSDKIQIIPYELKGLPDILQRAINRAKESVDIRFNFFISPPINGYLDWISKFKRIPRAVYLRNLVEKEMAKNKEYQSQSKKLKS